MMILVTERSARYGLHVNVTKTKVVDFSKESNQDTLQINNNRVEQVSSIKYLGITVNEDSNSKEEILLRAEQPRKIFTSMKNMFTSRDLQLRTRMLRCYIFSSYCMLLEVGPLAPCG